MAKDEVERYVLGQLARSGELLGRELLAGSAGLLHIGSLYVALARIEDRGLIEGFDAGGDGRLYALTSAGRQKHARTVVPPPRATARPRER